MKAKRASAKRNLLPEERDKLKQDYRDLRKELKKMIKDSKRNCWKQLIAEIDPDPWGKGYEFAVKRIKMGSLCPNMLTDKTVSIQKVLFLNSMCVLYDQRPSGQISYFTIEEWRR
nr:unnamed protein product [Callosobruchus chinensis]